MPSEVRDHQEVAFHAMTGGEGWEEKGGGGGKGGGGERMMSDKTNDSERVE